MNNTFVGGIQIVRVIMADHLVGGKPSVQLWVAATARGEAVDAVKKAIPAAWTAELTNQHLTPKLAALLKLRAGDVCELSSAT